jgi:hypothetical protein
MTVAVLKAKPLHYSLYCCTLKEACMADILFEGLVMEGQAHPDHSNAIALQPGPGSHQVTACAIHCAAIRHQPLHQPGTAWLHETSRVTHIIKKSNQSCGQQ